MTPHAPGRPASSATMVRWGAGWGAAGVLATMTFAAQPATAQPAAPAQTECDRLAQPPRQTMGRMPPLGEGVAYTVLRAGPARMACEQAMKDSPTEMRFVAYAARAADKAGDSHEAARLYRIAAEGGNPLAQNNFGVMLEAGEGPVPRNANEAARFYCLAADQGDPAGQANLATLYLNGRGGLPHNEAEAVRLWQLAAEQENAQAQNNLGIMYAQGRGGLARDPREAARMWRLAVDQGNTEARNNLRKLGVR